ncbi:kinase-like domain-containing protein [Delphinella strobiligena]|nr:kinase-like domain-containing protein [Delphinella strobiligena]
MVFKTLKEMTAAERQAAGTKFLKSKPARTGRWRGGKYLGEGGMAFAGLWVKVDKKNKITDRVVIKETPLNDSRYTQDDNYYHDPPQPLIKNRKPRELFCQQIVMPKDPRARSHILRIRSHRNMGTERTWRYVSDYCEKGDLQCLIDKHLSNHPDKVKPIPEAFLWYCFESLAIAAQDIESPPSLKPSRGEPARSQVVHQDIKPENIFLTAPDPEYFPFYPVVKLADFGGARLTHPGESFRTNPTSFRGDTHTEEFDPPELFHDGYSGTFKMLQAKQYLGVQADPERILSPTNIWQIGKVMLNLMSLDNALGNTQVNYYRTPRDHALGDGNGDDPWIPSFAEVKRYYHPALTNLVRECLQVAPGDRPSPAELRVTCREHINTHFSHERDNGRSIVRRNKLRFRPGHRDDHLAVGNDAGNFPR